MSTVTELTAALTAEFTGEIIFAEAVPAVLSVPSVVVSPGDPYLEPSTHGTITERWNVLVVVSLKDKISGLNQMRELSLRVQRAVNSAGGTWRSASGPRTLGDEARLSVISENVVTFSYAPATQIT